MSAETFGERFSRLVDRAGLSSQDVCTIVGWKSESSYYKARRGDISSMNAIGLLRLARRLLVSPYYLAGESEPSLQEEFTPPGSVDGTAIPTAVQDAIDRAALALGERIQSLAEQVSELAALRSQPLPSALPSGKRGKSV